MPLTWPQMAEDSIVLTRIIETGGTVKGKNGMEEEKIKELERQLAEEESKINGILRAGKIPAKADYADMDRIKNDLKVARRVKAMDAKRVDPKFTRQIGVRLTEAEYLELTKRAAESGVELSTYIRDLLKF